MKQFNIFREVVLTLLLICCKTVWAYDFKVDGIYYNITSVKDRTCIVTTPGDLKTVSTTIQFGGSTSVLRLPNENLYSGNIVIPQNPEYKGRILTVVGIDCCAFYSCKNLLSITIPPTVKYIADAAFADCTSLTAIYGDINATIGTSAFAGCKSLCDFNLKRCDFISHKAFQGCSSLTVISIPEMVSKIGEEAFAKCGRLSKVEFKDGQSDLSLYMDVFKDSPIDNMYIGRNLSYFTNSENRTPFDQITHLTIGDSVTSINNGISPYNVSGYGFKQLLEELSEAYKSVIDLSDLKTVVFGSLLSKVPAFKTAKLESITCRALTPPEVDGKFSYSIILNSILNVPKGAQEKYKAVAPWKDFVIKGTVIK